jgi:Dickkopf N-terminal cysteine-rich region
MFRGAPWVVGLVLLATLVAWLVTARGPGGIPSHAGCFAHRDCAKGEFCAVEPKGDGFATQGQCSEPCTDDEQCPNGWRCLVLVESAEGVLTPRGTGERRRVCRARTRPAEPAAR